MVGEGSCIDFAGTCILLEVPACIDERKNGFYERWGSVEVMFLIGVVFAFIEYKLVPARRKQCRLSHFYWKIVMLYIRLSY